jgi:site-specific DNA recombinase
LWLGGSTQRPLPSLESLRWVYGLTRVRPSRRKPCARFWSIPRYAGEMNIKGWGEPVQGDFKPLVSWETFDRAQVVLAGHAPTFVPHVRERVDFALRGLILCPDCGKPVIGSKSTGKAGNKFGYYRCHRVNGHMNVRAEVVESAFVDLLNRLTPKPERMVLIERIFRSSWTERIHVAAQESANLKSELAKEQAKEQRVLDLMADGQLSPDDFRNMNKSATDKLRICRCVSPSRAEVNWIWRQQSNT